MGEASLEFLQTLLCDYLVAAVKSDFARPMGLALLWYFGRCFEQEEAVPSTIPLALHINKPVGTFPHVKMAASLT